MGRSDARCPHDGGKCHHGCELRCSRLEAGSRLTTPWPGFPRFGKRPILGPLDEGHVVRPKFSRWELREKQMSNIARHIPCPDFMRAGGEVVCEECGAQYYDHPEAVPYKWLHVLCNGKFVKL